MNMLLLFRCDDWRKTYPGLAMAHRAKTLAKDASLKRAGSIFVKRIGIIGKTKGRVQKPESRVSSVRGGGGVPPPFR